MDPLVISHVQIPRFVYGTAWKKERTTELVTEAIRNGFTGIDTACQPKHYREDLVGEGIRKAIDLGLIKREALYVCLLLRASVQPTRLTITSGSD